MEKNLFVVLAIILTLITGCAQTYTSLRNPEMIGVHGEGGAKNSNNQPVPGDLVFEKTDVGIFSAAGSVREAADAQKTLIEANARAAAIRKNAEAEAELKKARANILNAYAENPEMFPTTARQEKKSNSGKQEEQFFIAFINVTGYDMKISLSDGQSDYLFTLGSQQVVLKKVNGRNIRYVLYNNEKGDHREGGHHIKDRDRVLYEKADGTTVTIHNIISMIPDAARKAPAARDFFISQAMKLMANLQ